MIELGDVLDGNHGDSSHCTAVARVFYPSSALRRMPLESGNE
jgi:hypothetical protein